MVRESEIDRRRNDSSTTPEPPSLPWRPSSLPDGRTLESSRPRRQAIISDLAKSPISLPAEVIELSWDRARFICFAMVPLARDRALLRKSI